MFTYIATTENIKVIVRPIYLDGQSNMIEKKFVFAYFIRIENHSGEEVQLLRRHWYISDAKGNTEEVDGDGVVGEQPTIPPGDAHEYNSFCVLKWFEGTMEGTFEMRHMSGNGFTVQIPKFFLKAAVN
jgi:ApaG protein